jgi:AcrR family transcriptional regulator
MTVYHQFGSKIGLLEAICDTLAASGGMDQMASAFSRPDPWTALDEYIAVFGRFWQSDRLLTRRLRGLAALDPEFEQVIRARDERRRQGLRVLVARLGERRTQPGSLPINQIVDVLYTLIAFEFFDALAGPGRSLEDVVPIVAKLARAALDL